MEKNKEIIKEFIESLVYHESFMNDVQELFGEEESKELKMVKKDLLRECKNKNHEEKLMHSFKIGTLNAVQNWKVGFSTSFLSVLEKIQEECNIKRNLSSCINRMREVIEKVERHIKDNNENT